MQTNSPIQIAFHHERPIAADAVRALYDIVHWWPHRQPEAITQMLNRDLAIGVWSNEQLIGFARAVTDGVFRAYIEDVMIHPDYHHQGFGRQMLTHLISALSHIETISLFCEPELVTFYEQRGFKVRRSHVVLHRNGEQ